MTAVSGFSAGLVPWLLLLFGVGLALGNFVGGKLANRSIDGTLIGMLTGLTAVMVLFPLTARVPGLAIAFLVLMGSFGFGSLPAVQTRVLHFAGDAGTLASSANVAAANLGNALGAALGGAAIAAGFGYSSPLWTGAAITFLAVGFAAMAARSSRRTRHEPANLDSSAAR